MLQFVLPTAKNKEDVLSFYQEFEKEKEPCIGYGGYQDFTVWLQEMQNRHSGENLPKGYVRENFYLCYDGFDMGGVFSLKFELTEFLFRYGGHVGYAVRPSKRNKGYAKKILNQGIGLAKQFGFKRILCVCDEDNAASEKVILQNGGVFENKRYDEMGKV